MPSLNKVLLMGNIGEIEELKQISEGKNVIKLTLATSEKRNDKKITTWHNVVIWDKQAELAEKYLTKGECIFIEGRINNRSYIGNDGAKKYVSEIIAERWQFAEKFSQFAAPIMDNKTRSALT